MREAKVRTVEQKYTIWYCDEPDCNYKIENNRGCCGVSPIMTCHFCEKDFCQSHIRLDYDSGDYPFLVSCFNCKEQRELFLEEYYQEDDE